MNKRKFVGTSKAKSNSKIRKVINTTHSRTLTVGDIVPKDWLYVKVDVVEKTNDHVLLKIEPLVRKNEKVAL